MRCTHFSFHEHIMIVVLNTFVFLTLACIATCMPAEKDVMTTEVHSIVDPMASLMGPIVYNDGM